jgi:hypothetical protein
VDGAEGAGGRDQLDEFGAVTDGPLGPKGAGQCRPKGEGLADAVEVEDRGEGGKSSRESKRRAKKGRGASRERGARSSHGQTRHKRHGKWEEQRGEQRWRKGRRRRGEKTKERETVIVDTERRGKRKIGLGGRENPSYNRLSDDSHSRIHFSNWKKSLATAAQGMCRTLDECGACSLVADDVEWESHPSNIVTTTVSGTTTTTVRARPVFIKPRIYAATEKVAVVISLFNYREVQWKEWTSASMALHQAMINSIGALNLSTIERLSGHAGILSLTCLQLLGYITVMFGSLHPTDVFYIENHIKEELTSFAAFRDFISRNSLNYDILAKIPHPISDITKIHWLENSLQRCPQFDIPIGTGKSLNTNVATRSYQSLVQYLSAKYSSLSPDTPSRGSSLGQILTSDSAKY